MAFDDAGSFVTIPLGLVMAVPAANWLGATTVETFGGFLWIGLALAPLAVRAVRHMTTRDIEAMGGEPTSALPG
jgi:hypothetical protein